MDKIDPAYKVLSISRQRKLLGISRSRYYYEPGSGHDEKDFSLLVKIKEVQIEHPYYGYRRIWREINKNGGDTTEAAVRRVMRRFGITAVFPGKNLSKACKYHKKYPYLLKKQGNQISESGMVNGYHLHKAAGRECLPDGNNRLVLKEGLELARVQHDGCGAVCKSSEGNNRRIRLSCNLQHRPGKPVYI